MTVAKAIIIKCAPAPSFIGNVVNADFWGTQDKDGKITKFYRVTPTKMTPTGQEILFAESTLSFLPPDDDVTTFDSSRKTITA